MIYILKYKFYYLGILDKNKYIILKLTFYVCFFYKLRQDGNLVKTEKLVGPKRFRLTEVLTVINYFFSIFTTKNKFFIENCDTYCTRTDTRRMDLTTLSEHTIKFAND